MTIVLMKDEFQNRKNFVVWGLGFFFVRNACVAFYTAFFKVFADSISKVLKNNFFCQHLHLFISKISSIYPPTFVQVVKLLSLQVSFIILKNNLYLSLLSKRCIIMKTLKRIFTTIFELCVGKLLPVFPI